MILQRSLETAPPSLRGVLRDSSPASAILWGAQTPCRPSRRASLPSLGDTTLAPCLLPSAGTRGRGLRGVGVPVPEPELSVETAGSLRFLGNPCVPMPCSQTPVGPRTPGHYGASTWPPLVSTTRAPAMTSVSGLNRTALGLAVYASSWRSPDTTQNSLPAARPSLAGRDFVTRRVATKGFRVRVSSPFPGLS